ncbi:MAG TPA: DUF2911 domain-containing protein [Terriglobales bacterium]|nr:DUF2911 domain-containing protein [Terriglobales bacterium]
MRNYRPVFLFVAVLLVAGFCAAQSLVLEMPRPSQHAVVSQRLGITDITITYHRPLVNNRKVWGTLVPYGAVWRAGANENTIIAFSDPVMIEGKPLERGTYGLHMIPVENEWTIIFSKNYTSWGAFTYDQKEDALRVTVKPQTSDFHDALSYDFDQLKPDAAVVTLRWEKIAVPFKVSVDVPHITQQSLEKQLRSLSQYTWVSWDEAANYLLDNKLDPQQALKYADTSIQNEERFENLITKSRSLERLDKKDEALAFRNKAFEKGTPLQVHLYARQLQNDKRQDEAFAIFRSNAQKNPSAWVVHTGLARVYCGGGDFDNAVKEMKLAVDGAPDKQQKTYLEGLVRRLEAKEDINK